MNHKNFIAKLSILIFGYSLLMISIISVFNITVFKVAISAIWVFIVPIFWTAMGGYWLNKIIKSDSEKIIKSIGKDDAIILESSFEEIESAYKALSKDMEAISVAINHANSALNKAESQTGSLNQTINDLEHKIATLNVKINQNEALFMASGSRLPLDIYLTDPNGNIIKSNKKVDIDLEKPDFIGDVLTVSANNFEMFKKKDFEKIMLGLKNGATVIGKSKRIFEKGGIKSILFIAENNNQERALTRTYLKKSRDLHFINEISKIISGQISIENTLQDAIDKIAYLGNFNSCSIRLINDEMSLELMAIGGYSNEFVMDKIVSTNHTHIGYAFLNNKILAINTLEDLLFEDDVIRNVLLNERRVAYIPLTNYDKSLGVMSVVSDYNFDTESMVLLESISINVTIALEKIILFERLKSNYFKTVEAFVTATEVQSARITGHARRVAQICKMIAEKLYLSSIEIDDVYIAGLLHDVGKLAYSDTKFEKSDRVDDHGYLGRRMVEQVGLNKDILEGIEYHHIDYDLSNYEGNQFNEQPFYAQIIRVANDFDFLMNTAGHSSGSKVIQNMLQASGKAYAPQFLRILNELSLTQNEKIMRIYDCEVNDENKVQ